MVMSMNDRRRVLFVCTANSARSLMAEALLRDMAGDQFEVMSAGTQPEKPHPMAIQCLEETGVPATGLASKSLDGLVTEPWDYVITLCDKAARECRHFPSAAQTIAWNFADPVPSNRHGIFMLLLKELKERLALFVMVHQKQTRSLPEYSPTAIFKALGDETRLAIMLLVQKNEELCVCELTAALDESQPKISRHLGNLRELGLLEDERRGQWVYYRLHPATPHWVLESLTAVAASSSRLLEPLNDRQKAMPDRPPKTDCA